jgi:opacity protein-like surface antigen
MRNLTIATLSLFALMASASFADTIVGSSGAGFQTYPVANVNENGTPYWDNTSFDGSNKNVGFQLVGLGVSPLDYWGYSNGSADTNISFSQNGLNDGATLQIEVAGNANINEFGWYQVGSPSILNPIFTGPDSPILSTTFDPSSSYGFYLKSGDVIYYTQSADNTLAGQQSTQHFAVFTTDQTPGSEAYWIGVEDLPVTSSIGACCANSASDFDYNDMIVKISTNSPQPIPEPSTYLLCGVGLLGLGIYRRRRSS